MTQTASGTTVGSSYPGEPFRDGFYRATAFETAVSWVHGVVPQTLRATTSTPRQALESAVLPALADPPCYVAFSGGRDSSAVLGVATRVARREGLPDPIPYTEIYPQVPEADESAWQRIVIEHLALRDWIRCVVDDESDLLGYEALQSLVRTGPVWPAPLQTKAGLFRRLHGGSVLTGEGGDEVFGFRRVAPIRRLLRERRHPRPLTLRLALAALAPRVIRRRQALARIRAANRQVWLRPAVADRHFRLLAQDDAMEPLSWHRSLGWLAGRRSALLASHNHRLLARLHGVTLVEPLLDKEFLAAVGALGGRLGYPSRAETMERLFGDILPEAVLHRRDKALFNRAFFGDSTRAFARNWDGSGVDPELVDPELLRSEWLSESPSALSGMLLQAAWLASDSKGKGVA